MAPPKEQVAIRWIEQNYLSNQSRSIYIALEEMNLIWDLLQVLEFEQMWQKGFAIDDIADYFDRDVDEVALLILDRAKKGHIQQRRNGINGK